MNHKDKILNDFKSKDLRTLSRLISRAENQDFSIYPILADLYEKTGHACTIGVTGPPGAGKSSLINRLIRQDRSQHLSVAVVAVDPVSPFTGGSLLGDRIRLNEHFNDPSVFIRSLSTRGRLGGGSTASQEVIHLLDAFGFNRIYVETVGVGQNEVEIRTLVQKTVVVLTPEAGDSIQMLKAGLLEIADLFVVNKADRTGAEKMALNLKAMLEISHKEHVPIIITSLSNDSVKTGSSEPTPRGKTSIDELHNELNRSCSKESLQNNKHDKRQLIINLLKSYIEKETRDWLGLQPESSQENPYQIMSRFLTKYPSGSLLPK